MQRCVPLNILTVRVCAQFDQSLDVLNEKLNTCEMQRCRTLIINLVDLNLMNSLKQKNSGDSIVSLRCAVVHSLTRGSLLCSVGLEMIHKRLNDLVVTSGSR